MCAKLFVPAGGLFQCSGGAAAPAGAAITAPMGVRIARCRAGIPRSGLRRFSFMVSPVCNIPARHRDELHGQHGALHELSGLLSQNVELLKAGDAHGDDHASTLH